MCAKQLASSVLWLQADSRSSILESRIFENIYGRRLVYIFCLRHNHTIQVKAEEMLPITQGPLRLYEHGRCSSKSPELDVQRPQRSIFPYRPQTSLAENTQEYHDPDRTYSDVAQTLSLHPNLSVRTSIYSMPYFVRSIHELTSRSLREWPIVSAPECLRCDTCLLPQYDVHVSNISMDTPRVPQRRTYGLCNPDEEHGHKSWTACEWGR